MRSSIAHPRWIIGLFALSTVAVGQEEEPPPPASTGDATLPGTDAQDDSTVQWSLTPFAWAISLDGEATVDNLEADIDVAFIDVVTESDTLIPLMFHVEAQADDWSIFLTTTYVYTDLEDASASLGIFDVEADVRTNLAWIELAGAIPLVDLRADDGEHDRDFRLELYAGARLSVVNIEINTEGRFLGLPLFDATDEVTETWVEPIIGLRSDWQIAEKLRLQARGDVGGFGAGSDFAWDSMVTLGFEFSLFGLPSHAFAGYAR